MKSGGGGGGGGGVALNEDIKKCVATKINHLFISLIYDELSQRINK